MTVVRPRPSLRAARLLAVAAALLCASPAQAAAAVLASGVAVRAEGSAPIRGGRVDAAYRQALEEAFRRGVLDTLRLIAPERQTPHDLETWQETVLTRAGEFVGAWRILSQEERDGFLTLEAEIEVWRDKLARAARAPRAAAAAPMRLVVLAVPLSLVDPAADEEVDAGRAAAAALEAELARRGAVIVAMTDRTLWSQPAAPAAEENRASRAAAAGRALDADAALVAQVTQRAGGLSLAVQLIAVASERTLMSARADVGDLGKRSLAEAFAPAARQLAAACAPHLPAARGAGAAATLP